MSTQVETQPAPDMFATATVPDPPEDAAGTTAPAGVPMGRVVGGVATVVLLVGGVALWAVSPWLALAAAGAAMVVGGLALLAPKLAARDARKSKRRRKERPRWRGWRPGGYANHGSGGSVGRPAGVGSSGASRVGGVPGGKFSLPRSGAPSGSSAGRRGGTGGVPAGAAAPKSRMGRLRQRLIPSRYHSDATPNGKRRSVLHRRQTSSPDQQGTSRSRWRLPTWKNTNTSDGTQGGRSTRATTSGTRRRWRPTLKRTGGTPANTGTPAVPSRRQRLTSAIKGAPARAAGAVRSSTTRSPGGRAGGAGNPAGVKRTGGQGSTPTHQRQTGGGRANARSHQGASGGWRHPLQRAKAVHQKVRDGDGKPPEKQTRLQYLFSRSKPATPPEPKRVKEKAPPRLDEITRRRHPRERSYPGGPPRPPAAPDTGSTGGPPAGPQTKQQRMKGPRRIDHTPTTDTPTAPREELVWLGATDLNDRLAALDEIQEQRIAPLSADDAGFPYIPPPTDTHPHPPTSTARLDPSSAASAFDDMGPLAPKRRGSTTVNATTNNSPDTSTRAARAAAWTNHAGSAHRDVATYTARADQLRGQAGADANKEGAIADVSGLLAAAAAAEETAQRRAGNAAAYEALAERETAGRG